MVFDAKYVIIGGGIAGTAAAETLRKRDPSAKIIVVSEEPYRLYSRVLLTKPNFFLEKIPFERIFLKDEKWYEDMRINLWRTRRAVRIDASEKLVHLDNGEVLHYEKLLLAVGGSPRKLPVPGADKEGVYYLRTIDETKRIIDAVKHSKRGVSIGGGIIGFEMAEMMQLAGMEVTFVILKPHYRIGVLGEETAKVVEAAMEQKGVRILRGAETTEIYGGNRVEGVRFKDGREIPADFVIIGIGTVTPGADFMEDAGVQINRGIVVNEFLETSVPDIWSAGDCTEYYDPIMDDVLQMGSWANAQAQGQTAAKNMLGDKEPYEYVSFFTTHGFGLAMTYVGDVRQDKKGRRVVLRGSAHDKVHGRIIMEGKRIVGALFVNSTRDVSTIAKLIEQKADMSRKVKQLADPSINLATLVKK